MSLQAQSQQDKTNTPIKRSVAGNVSGSGVNTPPISEKQKHEGAVYFTLGWACGHTIEAGKKAFGHPSSVTLDAVANIIERSYEEKIEIADIVGLQNLMMRFGLPAELVNESALEFSHAFQRESVDHKGIASLLARLRDRFEALADQSGKYASVSFLTGLWVAGVLDQHPGPPVLDSDAIAITSKWYNYSGASKPALEALASLLDTSKQLLSVTRTSSYPSQDELILIKDNARTLLRELVLPDLIWQVP